MAELFFIATTIFVAYVIFTVTDDKKTKSEPNKTEAAKPAVVVEPVEVKVEPKAEKPAPAKAKPATAKPAVAKPAAKTAKPKAVAKPKAAAAAPVASTEVPSDSLKNPKTGEVVKIPNSYAFAKRWVKDALVEEGLLDKIYKNNELDNEANAKIQVAIEQLKQMAKYH
jgi:BRCT domain type II-containing protein